MPSRVRGAGGGEVLTRETAAQLIQEHALGFLDICLLAVVFAEQIDGMLKWTHPRVVVHIKRPPRAKR